MLEEKNSALILKWIERIIKIICIILLIILTLTCFMQVVMRYVFNIGFAWVEEFAIFAMIWAAFIGGTICTIDESHPRVVALINVFPERIRLLLEALNNAISAGICLYLAYCSVGVVQFNWNIKASGFKVSYSVLYGAALVGFAFMALFFLINVYRYVRMFIRYRKDETTREDTIKTEG